jgi:hypothetical protein
VALLIRKWRARPASLMMEAAAVSHSPPAGRGAMYMFFYHFVLSVCLVVPAVRWH